MFKTGKINTYFLSISLEVDMEDDYVKFGVDDVYWP
jgi:hypothetical protein